MAPCALFAALLLSSVPAALSAPRASDLARRADAPPAVFPANGNVGPGGTDFVDSAHFRVYNAPVKANAEAALAMLEAAHECFVTDLGYIDSGLSNDYYPVGAGPYAKTNVYSVADLGGAAGWQNTDFMTSRAYLEIVHQWLAVPDIIVHEFGHVIHYHQRTWVNQRRAAAWWETFANWFADTYKQSDLCAPARAKHGQPALDTSMDILKVLGDSFQVIVDGTAGTGNHYQAWPLFTYLTNNPDDIPGLGRDVMRQMMLQYRTSDNETPLHTLARILQGSGNATVAQVVGRYWARMAHLEIGHPQARDFFTRQDYRVNWDSVRASGGAWVPIQGRAPLYMGANLIPLNVTGSTVGVDMTAQAPYTATLSIRSSDGRMRFVDVAGSAKAELVSGDKVALVVANTPSRVLPYDGFRLSAFPDVNRPLDYSFTLSGATVSVPTFPQSPFVPAKRGLDASNMCGLFA
ncbi:hypothetical protein MCOR04_007672 [Pyricularia oryzae]|nr:hypothetical protein MCOR13_009019 [Pyricularia oryzae]KAI6572402.1 hypothetical protein MCOR04_007672 [Pyricularia oryzae]